MCEEPDTVLKKFRKSDSELVSDILDLDLLDEKYPIYVKGEEDEKFNVNKDNR